MPQILSSPGSLVWFALTVLLLSAGFCTSLASLPNLGGLRAPEEPEEQQGCCWRVCLGIGVFPCTLPLPLRALTSLQGKLCQHHLPPLHQVMRLKVKWLNSKTSRDWVQCLVPLHYISFLRLPRGFWGEAEKIQWITWAMPGSRGLASRPILHKYVYISQGWDDRGL